MRQTLVNYFKAAFPAVAIQTTEEARVCADVIAAAKSLNRNVFVWSATEGMVNVTGGGRQVPDTQDLMAACSTKGENTVFVLKDPHTWPFDRDPVLLRSLRDFITRAPSTGCSVVIVAPEYKPHSTIEKLIVVLDYTLPSSDDLRNIAKGIAQSAGKEISANDDVIRALGGLTTTEAENALALSLVETKEFDASVIYREKVKAVKKSGLLDLVEPDERGLDAIGGLDMLKKWILMRKRVWSPEAIEFGLPPPKGILLVGIPGSGKSLSAKAIGTALGVPTLRLDIGSLFNSLVGESESRTRDALKLAEAISPCVLWCDEIDKGLAGSSGSGSNDSGVTKRVFGTIISWMQERARPVFLVATANDVTGLPPELLRKGRFDEIFAVDLPTAQERQEIFAIHLRKRKRDPESIDIQHVAGLTDGFTGSEIEAILDEGLFSAFNNGNSRALNTADLADAARATVPLSVTAKEKIDGIREWARNRARFASSQTKQETPNTRRLSE